MNVTKQQLREFAYIIHLGLSGCCAVFAVEMSKGFGYQIVGMIDEQGIVCHFCCLSEDSLIDASGKGLTVEVVSQNYVHVGKLRVETSTIEQVEAIICDDASLGVLDPPGYREALRRLFQDRFWDVWQELGRNKLEACKKSDNVQASQLLTAQPLHALRSRLSALVYRQTSPTTFVALRFPISLFFL